MNRVCSTLLCSLVAGALVAGAPVAGALLAAGCGAGATTVTVAGHTLTVRDEGLEYVTNRQFCGFLGDQQLRIHLVDYKPYCGNLPADSGLIGSRDPKLEHSELQLVLALSANPNHYFPFTVSQVDCNNGPGDKAIATFLHYPAGMALPDVTTQADSGKIFLTKYDDAANSFATGTYDLMFGGAHASGSFNLLACH